MPEWLVTISNKESKHIWIPPTKINFVRIMYIHSVPMTSLQPNDIWHHKIRCLIGSLHKGPVIYKGVSMGLLHTEIDTWRHNNYSRCVSLVDMGSNSNFSQVTSDKLQTPPCYHWQFLLADYWSSVTGWVITQLAKQVPQSFQRSCSPL